MADFEVYAFPNVFLGMGTDNDFVRDLQKGLGLDPSGVFDFLTMCYVVVHKHKQGLNYEEPVVDRSTWDSIFGTDSSALDGTPEETEFVATPAADATGLGAAETSPRPTITDDNTTTAAEQADRGQSVTGTAPANADTMTGTDTGATTVSTFPANPETTTAPNTTATDENAPASADPDKPTPVTDANTTTAEEQQAAGAPTPDTNGEPVTEPTPTEPAAPTAEEPQPDPAPTEPPTV